MPMCFGVCKSVACPAANLCHPPYQTPILHPLHDPSGPAGGCNGIIALWPYPPFITTLPLFLYTLTHLIGVNSLALSVITLLHLNVLGRGLLSLCVDALCRLRVKQKEIESRIRSYCCTTVQYIVLDSRNYFFVSNFVVFHFKIVFFGYNYNTKKKNQKVEKKKKGIDAADLRNVL